MTDRMAGISKHPGHRCMESVIPGNSEDQLGRVWTVMKRSKTLMMHHDGGCSRHCLMRMKKQGPTPPYAKYGRTMGTSDKSYTICDTSV